ncbi:MAG: GH36-type glycosyl hydrolase domain-containing protein [Gemmataceae bacterium]
MPSAPELVAPSDRPVKSPFINPFSGEPLRDELYGQAYLENYARELAAASASSLTYPARPIQDRLTEDDRILHAAYEEIREASHGQETLTTDAEWLLDNFFVVEDVLREVKRDLPTGYYKELPRLTVGSLAGYPRILALGLGLVAHTDSSLNEHQVREFVRAYQSVAPLTIGELWAVPTMLRLALLENLRRLAEQMTGARNDREYAARWVAEQVASGAGRPPERRSDPALVGIVQGLRDLGASAQPIVNWLDTWLGENELNPTELLRREHRRQAMNQVSVGNCITSLRLLNALDWNEFVEHTSLVEQELRTDPARIYARQDFQTRDRCRRAVEDLARGSSRTELDVARLAIRQAASSSDQPRETQVAYYLIDAGRDELERVLEFHPRWYHRKMAFFRHHPGVVYFGLYLVLLIAVLAALVTALQEPRFAWQLSIAAFALLPASELVAGLVNFVITRTMPPTVLPKLDHRHGIPEGCDTFIVMPSMLIGPQSAEQLLEKLELHYLANPDPQLRFALLTDFADAPAQVQPNDEQMLKLATDGVAELNRKHAADGPDRFFVFHRKRLWNESEGRWMGWERKRGKLLEFNRLLRGATDTSYAWQSGSLGTAPQVRYVITLDADTNLPRETARRLICAAAHPLNRARLNATKTKVVQGYGIFQPRVGFLFLTGTRSLFAKILASSAGMDPYQTAVSDVYMDLFGAGSFIGKGLYDVDAFEAVSSTAFPENCILSHDLIESNFARCALATDIELLDDFPARYHAYARREHRWVRGDWQILPWLFPTTPAATHDGRPTRRKNVLGLVERWKIVDNLRRSLVGPALIAALVSGWTWLPGPAWVWSLFALIIVLHPVWTVILGGIFGAMMGGGMSSIRGARAALPSTLAQCGLWFGFLLHQSLIALHAIGVTLKRLFFTHRHMLEWETAAAAEQRLGMDLVSFVRSMRSAPLVALVLAGLVAWRAPLNLLAAAPFLFAWFMSPLLAYFVSQPFRETADALTESERRMLRRLARKTWGFFEHFVGPEDNWLPPDNFQEDPKGEVAHRTSPTNMGLLLVSTVAASDFGYISTTRMLERLGHTMNTIEGLEKFRGHVLNWYDTQTLVPLQPGYISVVDSGNLMACLIATKNGLLEKADASIPNLNAMAGLADTLGLAEETLVQLDLPPAEREPVASRFRTMRGKLGTFPRNLKEWLDWCTGFLTEAEGAVAEATSRAARVAGGQLQRWCVALHEQAADIAAELRSLAPWLEQPGSIPEAVRAEMFASRSLADLEVKIASWRVDFEKHSADPGLFEKSTASHLLAVIQDLVERADALVRGMDFGFLYNAERNLFSIGYNMSVGRLDNAHYDILASECRIISFLAVARGEVPRKHWFQLSRPVTTVAGHQGLLSWGGTMFEYLMPRLLLPQFPGTLLDQAERAAVARQIEFGQKNGVPWGVSESGYYVLDAYQTYQYQSFGVPGLGLKRGLSEDVVIAPYASVMAVVIDPHSVCQNLDRLRNEGGEGPFGVYEAIDYTKRRIPAGKTCLVVRQYMAHHQGMCFLALANRLLNNEVPRRLHAEAMVRANDLLLQERVPVDAPIVHAPEDDESTRRVALTLQVPVSRRMTTADTPGPRTHILSNGEYTIMLTNSGAGFSTCKGLDVSRWREDRTRDAHGTFLYIRDLATGKYWSPTFHPTGGTMRKYEVTFSIDKVDYRRVEGSIESHLEITVSPETNVEVRKLTLTNHGQRAVELDVTSYVEVVLAPHGGDLVHPAFGKLFLETEWVPPQRALLCRRRPRAADQKPIFAVHTIAIEGRALAPTTFETDRSKFLGRRRTPLDPIAMQRGAELSGSTGPVLDPIFALRQRLRIEPGASLGVAFVTAVADTREEAIGLADQFNAYHSVLRAFDLAWAQSRVELRDLKVTVEESHLFQRLAGLVLYPAPHLRATPDIIRANRLGQPGLWKFGISGDLPIVLVRVNEGDDLKIVQQVVAAHTFWRVNGLTVDLVIVNEHPEGYLEGVQDQLMNIVRGSDANAVFDRSGGVFIRKADQFGPEDRDLLASCARVILLGERGSLSDQLDLPERIPPVPAALTPTRAIADPRFPIPDLRLHTRSDLILSNGFGGFTQDGHEYVMTFDPVGQGTPAPWSNVVATANFGFLVTEAGSGFTWSGNSQSNRLTPWSNDPVSDVPGEAVYIRDEATGEFWSITALPVLSKTEVRARHGQGYSVFERIHSGLEQELRLTIAPDDPVKIFRVRLINHTNQPRRVSTTFYAELVLGTYRDATTAHVATDVDAQSGTLLARNTYNPDYGTAVAFADVSVRPRTITGDRGEFLGRNGSPGSPAAFRRLELSNRVGAALDPCAAIMAKLDLNPGETKEVIFVLGQAHDTPTALALAEKYRDPWRAEQAFRDTVARWDAMLRTVTVKTPDTSLDFLLNRWLPYQVLSCRFWGRSAFYQSSGAFGFRDQLQDSLALVYARPDLTREHILRAAGHQFVEGDVQHWWHPPSDRGVRTRFSDDYLWLPFVTAFYVHATGDTGILDEPARFLKAPLLTAGQEEVYDLPGITEARPSLYEHCVKALDRASPRGAHDLPLMGTGDWNDGMNKVGAEGKGESVWLAWFLIDAYRQFATVAELRGDHAHTTDWRTKADELAKSVEANAWDGAWYRRAYFDDGTPLGSAHNDECQIDSLPQSWAVISQAGDAERSLRAMSAVEERLVQRIDHIILLFNPPFDHGTLQPGYIKGYVPGIRENGGQYTHAATWVVLATAMLRQGRKAMELVQLINPIQLSNTTEAASRYKVEPYVVAADVYGRSPHIGRGGWTWYTGSASWYYRVILERILGFELHGTRLRINPCIPDTWDRFEITYLYRSTSYRIAVENPQHVEHGIKELSVDGVAGSIEGIDLVDDGHERHVRVVMGT